MNALDLSLPPHSIEFEQAVLGGLLQHPQRLDDLDLTGRDMYEQSHRDIFDAIWACLNDKGAADVVLVAERLQADGLLDKIGGLAYLVELVNASTGPSNLNHYARAIRDKAQERGLIAAANEIAVLAQDRGTPLPEKLSRAQSLLSDLENHSTAAEEAISIKDALTRMVSRVDAAFHGEAQFLKTGFKDLDERVMGLEPGDMVVVAARPSIGKTAFAMQIAEHAAETEQVLMFSLEMRAEQLAMRRAAAHSKIDLLALRAGKLAEHEWGYLTYAVGKLRERNLFIDDRAGLSMYQIRARARQVKRKHGLGLVVIDYLGLIQGAGGENRTNVVSEISRQIKGMARELNVPVIALSQLNRGVEGRNEKRPVMSDLRDSGSIEQDADVILLLHREDYYNPKTQWKGVAECIIAKQRNGPTGKVPLTFLHEYAQFGDFVGSYDPDKSVKPARRGFE